jgi:hypothetical protein
MPLILPTPAHRSRDTIIGALQCRVRRRDRLGGLIHEYELAA